MKSIKYLVITFAIFFYSCSNNNSSNSYSTPENGDLNNTFEEKQELTPEQKIQGEKQQLISEGWEEKGMENGLMPSCYNFKPKTDKSIENNLEINVGGGTDVVAGGAGKGKGLFGKLTALPVVGTVAAILSMSGDTKTDGLTNEQRKANKDAQIAKNKAFKGTYPGLGTPAATTNNVTINVNKADPKATVDALSKYLKQNGSLPFNLATVGRG